MLHFNIFSSSLSLPLSDARGLHASYLTPRPGLDHWPWKAEGGGSIVKLHAPYFIPLIPAYHRQIVKAFMLPISSPSLPLPDGRGSDGCEVQRNPGPVMCYCSRDAKLSYPCCQPALLLLAKLKPNAVRSQGNSNKTHWLVHEDTYHYSTHTYIYTLHYATLTTPK